MSPGKMQVTHASEMKPKGSEIVLGGSNIVKIVLGGSNIVKIVLGNWQMANGGSNIVKRLSNE